MPEREQEEGGPPPPRGPGFRPLLRDSWRLFSTHVTTLLALFLPAFLALKLIQAGTLTALAGSSIPDFVGGFIDVGVRFVLASIVGSFAVALTALIVDGERSGEAIGVLDAWRAILPMNREVFGAAFLAAVLAMAISFVGFSVLLLPVFFGPPVIVHAIALERLPLASAWPRAKVLLSGNWGRALLYLAVISLTIALIQGLVGSGVIAAMSDFEDEVIAFTLFGPVRGLLDGIMLPFLAVAMYVLYRQLVVDRAD